MFDPNYIESLVQDNQDDNVNAVDTFCNNKIPSKSNNSKTKLKAKKKKKGKCC